LLRNQRARALVLSASPTHYSGAHANVFLPFLGLLVLRYIPLVIFVYLILEILSLLHAHPVLYYCRSGKSTKTNDDHSLPLHIERTDIFIDIEECDCAKHTSQSCAALYKGFSSRARTHQTRFGGAITQH
jgi:hypothetical protein